jgi:hypothetical protein
MKLEAAQVNLAAAEAETEVHRMATELLRSTGATDLNEVFAHDQPVLNALQIEGWSNESPRDEA